MARIYTEITVIYDRLYNPAAVCQLFDLNYLAHQHLSFGHDQIMVGNFIADAVKGKDWKNYSEGIQLGIEVHRFIDSFTDTHSLPLESRKLLYGHFGKYAAVVQDVFYDHFLARDWPEYSNEPLHRFAQKVYLTLQSHRDALNERSVRTLHYMSMQNWLEGYAAREGIDRALKGMATRASFVSHMDNALPALDAHFHELQDHFSVFFPQLESAVHDRFADRLNP